MAKIKDEDLVFHFLNVGFGDNIVVELPKKPSGKRSIGIVDCYKGAKTQKYLDRINAIRPFDEVAFVCATHPHYDHVAGITGLLEKATTRPNEFWDSGFRHASATYKKILEAVRDNGISMTRVSSGMEWYFGKIRVTALAPSVSLRNRYGTYGIDMNNASVVLRFEHCEENVVTVESLRYQGNADPELAQDAGAGVVILGGDAEFDSWAKISEEYPCIISSSKNKPLVKKMVNLLKCAVVKVSHHGSMHSAPLDIYERMSPKIAVVSNKQETSSKTTSTGTLSRKLFPHDTTALALREVGAEVVTTDGSYEQLHGTDFAHTGTVVVVVPPGKRPRYTKLTDTIAGTPTPVTDV